MEAKNKKFFINEIKKHLTDGYTIIPNDNLIMLGYFGKLVPSRIEEVYLDDDGIVCVIVRRMNDGEENCLDYDRLDDFDFNEVQLIFSILVRDGLFENETAMNTKDAFVLVVTNQDGKITNVNVFHDEDKAIEEMNNQMTDCVNDALARGNKYIVSKKTYWGFVKADNGSEYHWDIVQDFNYNTRL